jgi:hypothetical protein
MRWLLLTAALSACAGTQTPTPAPLEPAPPPPVATTRKKPHVEPPGDPAPKHLIDIDWNAVSISTDAEALALWDRFGITGADWEARLEEIPTDKPFTRPLAIALLHAGNFACPPVRRACQTMPMDVEPPKPTASLADPCLRRLAALWAIDQLEPADVPGVTDALHKIASLPPPESQLVAAAITMFPETNSVGRLQTLALAWAAGQHDLVNTAVGTLEEPELIAAATKFHIDGAVEVLSPVAHRKVYLAAIADPKVGAHQRKRAIEEIAQTDGVKLLPDAKAAIVAAATGRMGESCEVAALAARRLADDGDRRFVPHPGKTPLEMMRQLCVLAFWQASPEAENDKVDPYPKFIGPAGLEEVKVTYDSSSEEDLDGDGDPHTEHVSGRVPAAGAALPEIDDLAHAMEHCDGAQCESYDRIFKFAFKPGGPGGAMLLSRLDVDEKPPCATPPSVGP